MFSQTTVLLSCLAIATSGFSVHPSAKNTVQDAHDQLSKPLRCWEPVEEGVNDIPSTGGFTLSEPKFELCSYMPDPKDFNKYYVNGVDLNSDDYSKVLSMFQKMQVAHRGYAMLNVCLQEGFQFHAVGFPSQVSMRCLCKRDGCNLPKGLTQFLDYNKLPMPETF